MDNNGKIEEIKKKVEEGLYLNRVPPKTRKEFIEWCKEEFCDDRGMGLKWLMDFKLGLLSNPNQLLSEQIEFLMNEIEQLKAVPKEEPKKKVIRSLSGRLIAEKSEE